jgi:low affinity Fe/Cu permease
MIYRLFENLAKWTTNYSGSMTAFVLALSLVIGWFIAGFYYHFSDSHSLFINTITTIITFLMTFLIQHNQNKSSLALQGKLDELIAAQKGAEKVRSLDSISELTDQIHHKI